MSYEYLISAIVALLIVVLLFKGKKTPALSQATDEDVIELVRAGNKVTAIKYYRSIHGVSLTDAKHAVDDMARSMSESSPSSSD